MKKVFALIICVLMICSVVVSASASQSDDKLVSRTVEFLDNGDYIVNEVYEPAIQPRSDKTGYAISTYKNSNGTAIWAVRVTGTFTYNGSSSRATSSVADVLIYNNSAAFVSKNASYSGNSAKATGTVRYDIYTTSRTATVSCDKNGNIY